MNMKLRKADFERINSEMVWLESVQRRGLKLRIKEATQNRKAKNRAKFLSSKRLPKNVK